MLSITTDYASVSTGTPEPYLRRIAEAGFSHVHWCHQWNTDFLYSDAEIDQIARWMRELGLALTDLHGSMGQEKNWGSARDYERLAGVDLVRNRIEMAARLGSDVVIMHLPSEPPEAEQKAPFWSRMRRSLDELDPVARSRRVRLAIENTGRDSFDAIERVFALYGPEVLGLCYDSGHGNVAGNGLDRLDRAKDRLIAVHLHDNDGSADQHKLVFDGTVDWPRLARILAASPYSAGNVAQPPSAVSGRVGQSAQAGAPVLHAKPVSMESNLGSYPKGSDEMEHLRKAFEAGTRLTGMIERDLCPFNLPQVLEPAGG